MYQVSVSSLFPVLTPSSNTFSHFHPRKFSRCNFYKTPRCHANRTLLIFFPFHRTSKLTQGKKMKRFKIPNFHPRKILKKSRESWFKNFHSESITKHIQFHSSIFLSSILKNNFRPSRKKPKVKFFPDSLFSRILSLELSEVQKDRIFVGKKREKKEKKKVKCVEPICPHLYSLFRDVKKG